MAGIGIETNKVYPSRKDQLNFGSPDYEGAARSRSEGGGAHSRLKYDEDSYEKAQSRMTLDDVRWGEMRKKIPGMGRVPKTRLYNMDPTMDNVHYIFYICFLSILYFKCTFLWLVYCRFHSVQAIYLQSYSYTCT